MRNIRKMTYIDSMDWKYPENLLPFSKIWFKCIIIKHCNIYRFDIARIGCCPRYARMSPPQIRQVFVDPETAFKSLCALIVGDNGWSSPLMLIDRITLYIRFQIGGPIVNTGFPLVYLYLQSVILFSIPPDKRFPYPLTPYAYIHNYWHHVHSVHSTTNTI